MIATIVFDFIDHGWTQKIANIRIHKVRFWCYRFPRVNDYALKEHTNRLLAYQFSKIF